jgi:hypothetical protein
MTDRQYQVLLDLYNECNEDFWHLPASTREAFFNRLFSK